jgi:dCMP deaminase
MTAAYEQAQRSLDPSTQNGAVLVKDGEIIGRGHNHFPYMIENTPERWNNRDLKYPLVVHAEVDAVNDAILNGHAPMGATLYVAWGVCHLCAKDLIEKRIHDIVCHQIPEHNIQQPVWNKSIEDAMHWLRETCIPVRWLHGVIGTQIRLNGKLTSV